MSTPLPPDPYIALGVSKDATPAQVKTTYRKLVLKHHPDKVTDESKKAEASDQFHRIQQAYEILSDEGRRARYDAQVKLVELRKQAMNSKPTVEVKTAAYEVPTSGPGRAAFTTRGPTRVHEERRPERSDSDDYFSSRTTSRKHDDYERRKTYPRDDGERARMMQREKKENEKNVRSDKRKTRDQEQRREREHKFQQYDEDNEADLSYEADLRRKRENEAARGKEQRGRERVFKDDYERERDRDHRSGYEQTTQRYTHMEDAMNEYTGRSKQRPPLTRSASTRGATYVGRSSTSGAAYMRRHSTKPRDSTPPPPSRKMSVPDVETVERKPMRPSNLYTSASSHSTPRHNPERERGVPARSPSVHVSDRYAREMPSVRRAETMPNLPPRTKESKSSIQRGTEYYGGLPTPSPSPDRAQPPTRTYHYPRHESSREDLDHRRDRERERDRRTHSPEPIRQSKSSAAQTSRYNPAPQPPPVRRNHSYSSNYTAEPTTYSSSRRDAHDRFYGEVKANSSAKYSYPVFETSHLRDYGERRRASPDDYDIDISPKKTVPVDDIRKLSGYSSRRGHVSSSRPSMSRQNTYERQRHPIHA